MLVHVIDPAVPGPGVYTLDEPDYLILNTPCGQISLFPWSVADAPDYGLGLYEWARQLGYRWVGDSCIVGVRGREISPHDYLPRRVMGSYLQWFFETLVEEAPFNLEVVTHRSAAVDLSTQASGREAVLLANGKLLEVDSVVLTTGHTQNLANRDGLLRPYPVTSWVDGVPSSCSVGIMGMGLVGTDVVTALTVGRGGRFTREGTRLRYHQSGREPKILLFSRSGLPYCAKAVETIDETDDYSPVVCTPEAVGAIRPNGRSPSGRVDLRTTMLPLVLAEMQARYYVQSATLAGGNEVAKKVRFALEHAWIGGTFDAEVMRFAARYGSFDVTARFFSPLADFGSPTEYQERLYEAVETDLSEAQRGGSSPVKSAYEVLRFQRDAMRSVIEFGGLTIESYLDFHANIRTRVSRIVAGPPALRSEQLLALFDGGIVEAPLGPAPRLSPQKGGRAIVRSSELDVPHSAELDLVISGYLEDPSLHLSSSPLLTNLYHKGRLQQFSYDDTPVGSVALTESFHPVSRTGREDRNIFVFGALTEGVRYFTHYVPSPKSRLRAFLDAEKCVQEIFT